MLTERVERQDNNFLTAQIHSCDKIVPDCSTAIGLSACGFERDGTHRWYLGEHRMAASW